MSAASLEERVVALEVEMAELKRSVNGLEPAQDTPWWERRFGAFQDDAMYDEAAELGRKHRLSEQLAGDEPS